MPNANRRPEAPAAAVSGATTSTNRRLATVSEAAAGGLNRPESAVIGSDSRDWRTVAEAPEDWTAERRERLRETIRAENMLALAACDALQAAMNARLKPWSGRPQARDEPEYTTDQIVLLELGRSSKTFEAIRSLCREGYGEQAAMLNRSLFEGMAVAHWVHSSGPEAEPRIKEALRFDEHLAAVLIEEVQWSSEVDVEEVRTADELRDARLEGDELSRMEGKFGKYGEWMWTGHRNMLELLKSIENQWDDGGLQLWQYFKVINRDNNQLLHSTASGLTRAFSRHSEGGAHIWVGASNVHVNAALFGAYWTFGQTASLIAERFELNDREGLGSVIAEGQFGFHELSPSEAAHLGRNDPCPCESGKKYKHCHSEQVEAIRRVRQAG